MNLQLRANNVPLQEPNPKKRSVADYLLDSLHLHGARHIFGVPGDYVLRFDKRIEEHPLTFINATRENTAGLMADAYARTAGLGVACITYGVGMEIVNAVAQAFVEDSPLVIISGSAAAKDFMRRIRLHHLIGTSQSTSRDETQEEIFKHLTIGQAILNNPATTKQEIDRILSLCLAKKKPVYIEIPSDMVDAPVSESSLPAPAAELDPKALDAALDKISHLLEKSKKAAIWAGHEIQRRQLALPLLAFAEKHAIPVATTLLGKGAIDETHPLSMGIYQGGLSRPEVSGFIDSCDTLLMLGVLLTDLDTGFFTAKLSHKQQVIAGGEKVVINGTPFGPVCLEDLVGRLPALPLTRRFDAPVPHRKAVTPAPMQKGVKITTKRAFECIQSFLKPEHLLFADIGDCLFGGADLVVGQDGFASCAHFGALGFAVPGAIGAQIASPNRRVIALAGDGAFQMTATELSTAVRYHADPVIIIFNNKGYGTERVLIEGKYNDIQNWNYPEIARLVNGGRGVKARTEDELADALGKALKERGMYHLIEIELDKLDFSPAMHRFEQLVNKNAKP